MILTDVHTHSTYSADGESSLEDMVNAAVSGGVKFFGVSEHFDYDYNAIGLKINGKPAYTDADSYFGEGRALQCAHRDLQLLLGCEFGYSENLSVQSCYADIIKKFSPDFVVNSVHTCKGYDCWFDEYFIGKSKREAYEQYLNRVLESLSAPYSYDIIGHIGYVSRNAPYDEPKLNYVDFASVYDAILKQIVERGKILEVNSSTRSAGSPFLPDIDVLKRYYALGGRKVSFASDAHSTVRICDKREIVIKALRETGFGYITVPCRGSEIKVNIK